MPHGFCDGRASNPHPHHREAAAELRPFSIPLKRPVVSKVVLFERLAAASKVGARKPATFSRRSTAVVHRVGFDTHARFAVSKALLDGIWRELRASNS